MAEARYDDALTHLEAALALNPGFDDARLDLIELLLANNRSTPHAPTERLSPQTVQNGDPRYQAIRPVSTRSTRRPTCRRPTRSKHASRQTRPTSTRASTSRRA